MKILPFKYPVITTYPGIAFFLSGLLNHDQFIPFFYSNYIQIISEDHNDNDVDPIITLYSPNLEYEPNPLIHAQRFPKSTIDFYNNDIIDFITHSIDENFYIFSFVDEFYIPASPLYHQREFPHSILVYGYDEYKKQLNIAGYFENWRYGQSNVNFEDFRLSYNALQRPHEMGHLNYFQLFKYDTSRNEGYHFDIQNVIDMLEDYYYSRNSSSRHRSYRNPVKGKFGLSSYEDLKKHLQILEGTKQLQPKRHAFQIVWEHKTCMLQRIGYMFENGYLKSKTLPFEAYKRVEQKALILRNLMIKYEITKNSELISKMINLVDHIINEERMALEILLDEINATMSSS